MKKGKRIHFMIEQNIWTSRYIHSIRLFCKGVPVNAIRLLVLMLLSALEIALPSLRRIWPSSQITKSGPIMLWKHHFSTGVDRFSIECRKQSGDHFGSGFGFSKTGWVAHFVSNWYVFWFYDIQLKTARCAML